MWVGHILSVISHGGNLHKRPIPRDFPGGPMGKNLPANSGDTGSIPGLGRFHMLHKINKEEGMALEVTSATA